MDESDACFAKRHDDAGTVDRAAPELDGLRAAAENLGRHAVDISILEHAGTTIGVPLTHLPVFLEESRVQEGSRSGLRGPTILTVKYLARAVAIKKTSGSSLQRRAGVTMRNVDSRLSRN
jgi:hypothetical protein